MALSRVSITPSHAKIWWLAPGIALLADEVVLHDADLARLDDPPRSRFDASSQYSANRLRDESDLVITSRDLSHFDPQAVGGIRRHDAEGELRVILQDIMVDRGPGLITAVQVRNALLRAYSEFIKYSRSKLKLLLPEEPQAVQIRNEKLPEWKGHTNTLRKLKYNEVRSALPDNEPLWQVAVNVIAVSRSIIDMMRAGHHVYDPLYSEFAPTIEFLVRKDVFWEHDDESDPISVKWLQQSVMYELSRLQPMTISPLTLSDLLRARRRLAPIRALLGEQHDLWADAASLRAAEVTRTLSSIRASLDKLAPKLAYPLWIASVVVATPALVRRFGTEIVPWIVSGAAGSPVAAKVAQGALERLASILVPDENDTDGTIGTVTQLSTALSMPMKVPTVDAHFSAAEYWTTR